VSAAVLTAQAELDAMDELQRASDGGQSPMSADERAAMEMQAAMDAERAERAAKAAAVASSDRPEPLCLAVRTSLLSEFRNSGGVLQAFEVCHGQTTFGVLCSALSRMPGVEFPDHNPHSWFRRPSRFTFRDQLYQVSIPHENIRVCPVNKGLALIEMEELLEYVRHNVLRSRASRYTVR
jgi:cell division septation protein DedD